MLKSKFSRVTEIRNPALAKKKKGQLEPYGLARLLRKAC